MSEPEQLLERVITALTNVKNPLTGEDVVSGGQVQDLSNLIGSAGGLGTGSG